VSCPTRSQRLGGYFDLDQTVEEIKGLETQAARPDFWSKQNEARAVQQKLADLQKELTTWQNLKQQTEELLALSQEVKLASDEALQLEITTQLTKLTAQFAKLEFLVLFDEKYDSHNAILAIHAGTGGVEAQDWAEMLLRMYLRFCENQDWQVQIIDESRGNEAGIKSVVLEVVGHYAYGYLKAEAGVHRLVRISPFDAEKMRHTSFALVEALPELAELEAVTIKPEDLEIEMFRAGGKGGQNVNKVSTAVRIRHLPSGLVVKSQSERSQEQNRQNALKVLRAKLHQLAWSEKQAEKQQVQGEHLAGSWGNQIRSYVMQPYQMVKDHRTKFEVSEVGKVLDGELLSFIESYLKWQKQVNK